MRLILRLGVVAIIGAAVALVAGLTVRRVGLSADRTPSRIETFVAQNLVRLAIPAAPLLAAKPANATSDAWHEGADLFGNRCAMCHGSDGRGDKGIGTQMYPPVPDLTADAIQRFSDGALFTVIRHGVSWTGMPSFQKTMNEDDTWKLVAFIRKAPTMTTEDRRLLTESAEVPTGATRIVMDGTRFHPQAATVAVGSEVVWANSDPFPHNVNSPSGHFRSADIDPDGTWRLRPTERGTFEYQCTLHPGMKAVLTVQ
jgi:mono/diheme cytochrome c family protein